MFAFDYDLPNSAANAGATQISMPMFQIPNFRGTYRLFPIARNKIMIRLENLDDVYDQGSRSTAQMSQIVNLEQFARDLYKYVNPLCEPQLIEIQEVTLSGGEPIEALK